MLEPIEEEIRILTDEEKKMILDELKKYHEELRNKENNEKSKNINGA